MTAEPLPQQSPQSPLRRAPKSTKDIIKDGHRNRNDDRGSRNTHDDVQRAIDGLKDIPDDELQEFLDDEDFNIVDTWEGDEERPEDIGGQRNIRDRDRRHSRSKRDRRRGSPARDRAERARREERRREDARRDPTKSSKDIERDKMRTKRDTDSKMLAEKEKAIKHLLDSDTIVPPGTEVEAIETERLLDRGIKRSRERRRTLERHRNSPVKRRSRSRIRLSPSHRDRSPLVPSPDTRRRSLDRRRSSERRKRPSWERRSPIDRRDRRGSPRRRVEGRDLRPVFRRSRSRERRRTRTPDRKRRLSRSPVRRGSPRRRSFSKSPDRRRKRSPFINEIARQFRDEALMSTASVDQFIGRPGLLPTPMHPVPPASQHYLPMMDPVVPMGMPAPTPAPFIPFDPSIPQPMSFEPVPMHQAPIEYNAAPVMYNQGAPIPQERFGLLPVPSPQPVPAPANVEPARYSKTSKSLRRSPSPRREFSDGHYERKRERSPRGASSHNGGLGRPDRLKTPEPPVISNSKPFEKTSLSSLLEASVSAKDSGCPVLYPGFKPEILRNCEMALRSLPEEDPRLKMSGRFFYDPTVEEPKVIKKEMTSNSLLVQRTKNKIIWDDEEEEREKLPPKADMFQKYTQTESLLEEKSTQTSNESMDFCAQVCPGDFEPTPPPVREEKRPIMDRLDWSVRDNYDFPAKRDAGDLRWSLSNARSWNLGSPSRVDRETRTRSPERGHEPRDSRAFDLSPIRSREEFSHQSGRGFGSRERDRRGSPTFRRSMERQDDYDNRSDRSRGGSPSGVDESDDIEIIEESFSRDNWRGRGKSFGSLKARSSRAKFSTGGRPYRGRGSGFRGKF
ncbi:serine/arginine repetitive matrix protein 1 isoform X2 [Diachasma alloeum]|uniref:serine/arginine repetitive matrix protein 1 isoform X2 n=1 Tax=Diachasma alloeum TaxID=454923 RepID=UPI0007382B2A|nr:serine/arginine repetitive matrix protein 1 isoform X2 [Diachasma alloeum]